MASVNSPTAHSLFLGPGPGRCNCRNTGDRLMLPNSLLGRRRHNLYINLVIVLAPRGRLYTGYCV